tara:strand:+ start:2220 stop:2519 length:300 start_codon:yes stop_codon:yes gene_type:complete
MKKGPLSNEEKQFVTDNVGQFDDVESLADKMDRSVGILQRFIKTMTPKGEDVSKLFARNEERGVTVMTQAASMASDENKKERPSKNPDRFSKFIHKIKE